MSVPNIVKLVCVIIGFSLAFQDDSLTQVYGMEQNDVSAEQKPITSMEDTELSGTPYRGLFFKRLDGGEVNILNNTQDKNETILKVKSGVGPIYQAKVSQRGKIVNKDFNELIEKVDPDFFKLILDCLYPFCPRKEMEAFYAETITKGEGDITYPAPKEIPWKELSEKAQNPELKNDLLKRADGENGEN